MLAWSLCTKKVTNCGVTVTCDIISALNDVLKVYSCDKPNVDAFYSLLDI